MSLLMVHSNRLSAHSKVLEPIPQFKATAKLGEFLEARVFLPMVQSVGPQRLKPEPFGARGGTAEAVPFPFLPSLYSKSRNALAACDETPASKTSA
jgi:hypothetical protein